MPCLRPAGERSNLFLGIAQNPCVRVQEASAVERHVLQFPQIDLGSDKWSGFSHGAVLICSVRLQPSRARLSNDVVCGSKNSAVFAVGPWRCLAKMTSAMFFTRSSWVCQSAKRASYFSALSIALRVGSSRAR